MLPALMAAGLGAGYAGDKYLNNGQGMQAIKNVFSSPQTPAVPQVPQGSHYADILERTPNTESIGMGQTKDPSGGGLFQSLGAGVGSAGVNALRDSVAKGAISSSGGGMLSGLAGKGILGGAKTIAGKILSPLAGVNLGLRTWGADAPGYLKYPTAVAGGLAATTPIGAPVAIGLDTANQFYDMRQNAIADNANELGHKSMNLYNILRTMQADPNINQETLNDFQKSNPDFQETADHFAPARHSLDSILKRIGNK